jgi:hypothetical protein
MTIAIKPTASGSTIEQNGSTILTVDGSGNITPSNNLYPKVPSFSARLSADQTGISNNTFTKVTFDTELWDTDGDYDNATNYRYTPSVAGKYQVSVTAKCTGSGVSNIWLTIYKNGSHYTGQNLQLSSDAMIPNVSILVDMNGSTDYLEAYAYINASSGHKIQSIYASSTVGSNFSAHLVSV